MDTSGIRMTVALRRLTGAALSAALDDLAQLRITVFRDWPYLYDGDMVYERNYLRRYSESDAAVLVAAFDDDRLVGAATGTPLEDHAEGFAAPFAAVPIPLEEVFYCAESVLLPEYRGRGLGHGFFDMREDHARALGRRYAAFCAVIRPEDHPARPADYRPLDAFWRKRGYEPVKGAVARYSWKDHGDRTETEKPMQIWLKEL
jgi:GNAT superfamily N-acetyltransferase